MDLYKMSFDEVEAAYHGHACKRDCGLCVEYQARVEENENEDAIDHQKEREAERADEFWAPQEGL